MYMTRNWLKRKLGSDTTQKRWNFTAWRARTNKILDPWVYKSRLTRKTGSMFLFGSMVKVADSPASNDENSSYSSWLILLFKKFCITEWSNTIILIMAFFKQYICWQILHIYIILYFYIFYVSKFKNIQWEYICSKIFS